MKITKKIIEAVCLENVTGVKQVIHQPATNLWFFKFGDNQITEETYNQLNNISMIPQLNKSFDQKHKTIMAKLNLNEVNTYYERMLKNRSGN